MELLFSPRMAVSAVIAIVTLWRVAPIISMLHTWARCWPAS